MISYEKTKKLSSAFKKVKDYLAQINGITLGPLGVSLAKETATSLARDFSNILESLWEEIKDEYKCFMIVFDETDKLAKSEEFAKDFAFSIRSVMEHFSERNIPNIKFVVSALPETYNIMITAHPSIARAWTVIDLGRFDKNSTCELLKLGLDSASPARNWDENFLKMLYEQSDGIPYHIQLICYYAFESDRDMILSEDDFEPALEDAIQLLDSKVFGPNWVRVKNYRGYKELLTFLAKTHFDNATKYVSLDDLEKEMTDFSRPEISAIVSALRSIGFIAPSEKRGQYCLSSTLCCFWLKKYPLQNSD